MSPEDACRELAWLQQALPGMAGSAGAMVAASIALLTWVASQSISGLVWWFRNFSDRADLMRALRSEIKFNSISESYYSGDEFEKKAANKIISYALAGHKYKFFAPIYDNNAIFDNVKGNIVRLPGPVVGWVTAYYNLSGGLTVAIGSLQTDEFAALDQERKVSVIGHIAKLANDTNVAAKTASSYLSAALFAMYALLVILGIGGVELVRLALPTISDEWRQTVEYVSDLKSAAKSVSCKPPSHDQAHSTLTGENQP